MRRQDLSAGEEVALVDSTGMYGVHTYRVRVVDVDARYSARVSRTWGEDRTEAKAGVLVEFVDDPMERFNRRPPAGGFIRGVEVDVEQLEPGGRIGVPARLISRTWEQEEEIRRARARGEEKHRKMEEAAKRRADSFNRRARAAELPITAYAQTTTVVAQVNDGIEGAEVLLDRIEMLRSAQKGAS